MTRLPFITPEAGKSPLSLRSTLLHAIVPVFAFDIFIRRKIVRKLKPQTRWSPRHHGSFQGCFPLSAAFLIASLRSPVCWWLQFLVACGQWACLQRGQFWRPSFSLKCKSSSDELLLDSALSCRWLSRRDFHWRANSEAGGNAESMRNAICTVFGS